MKMVNYKIKKFGSLSKKVKADSKWGKHFKDDVGFTVRLNDRYFMSVFIDSRLVRPNGFLTIKRPEQIIARCISCVGEIWEVRAEPTGVGRVGLVVYTHRGKALASGKMSMDEDELNYTLKTLYKGITNKVKIDYTVKGTVKTGLDGKESYEGTISLTVSDSR